jgi:hypothetical protein
MDDAIYCTCMQSTDNKGHYVSFREAPALFEEIVSVAER